MTSTGTLNQLNCLFSLGQIVARPEITLNEILTETVKLLPPAWSYPDVAGARISFENQQFETKDFVETEWCLKSTIKVHDRERGSIEVCYREKRPDADIGPFLTEEKTLIETVAQWLGIILERERVEEHLARERMLLRTLIDNTPDFVYVKDAQSRFVICNIAVARSLGVEDPELVLGKTDFDFHIKDLAEQYFTDEQNVIRTGKPLINREELVMDPAGKELWYLSSKVPVYDQFGKIVFLVGIGRNITKRKMAEEELKDTMRQLERSNRELEQFAYIASHDLQEPLRMVSSFTQLLAKRYQGKLDSDADEFIGYACEGAKRMQRLLNDLLEYSRVTTRARPMQLVSCESVLKQVLDNLKLAIEDAGAKITHDPLPDVLADETQLLQVFQNLIGNAIKFRGENSPHIHVSAKPEDGMAVFSVRDNGIGINPEHVDRVFQIFQRLVSRDKYPGTGIGLAICKKIIERHGGAIWVESNPDRGSTFYFSLMTREDGGK